MPLLTETLWYSLHVIFGTLPGIEGLVACITVIALFAAAFQNYENGDDQNNSTF